jgi:hypothetical protein
LATRSTAFCTVSAGISSSSSRRQVASVMGQAFEIARGILFQMIEIGQEPP